MENNLSNYDFEEWEGDYQLIQEEDWGGLVKLRKWKAEKNPEDLHCQWRVGEALVFNQEFKQALDLLTQIYIKESEFEDVIHSILDALYGLEKTAVLKLNDKTKNLCKDFLKNKKKPIPFLSIYENLLFQSDYLAFKEKELYEYLKNDEQFEFSGNELYFWDVDIKLSKM